MSASPIAAVRKIALPLLMAGTLTSCGGGSSGSAPVDHSIVIAPASISWAVAAGACTFSNPPADHNDHLINITAFDAQGNPRSDVDIEVTLELTGATASIFDTMFLFDDFNRDGILQPGELVLGTSVAGGPNVYRTETDDLGNKQLWLRLDLGGCTYTANLRVVSGSVTASLSVSVTN